MNKNAFIIRCMNQMLHMKIIEQMEIIFLNNLNIPRLSEEQKQSCEGEITVEEITAILNSFENNKSLRNDRIPIAFYKTCWDLITDIFTECVRQSYNHGEMSSSQRKAIISLIEKQGKDRTLIENWRPISHYCRCKNNLKINCNKTEKSFTKFQNQTGYVEDRYIGETIRSVFDKMEFTDSKNIPGILTSLTLKRPLILWNGNISLFALKLLTWDLTFKTG